MNETNYDEYHFACQLAGLDPKDFDAFFKYLDDEHPGWTGHEYQWVVNQAALWKDNSRELIIKRIALRRY